MPLCQNDIPGDGSLLGLGEQFARQFAARGGDLVLAARSADRPIALAEDLRARRRVTVTTLPADLSLADEVSRVASFTATTEVHVLVNNAGFGTSRPSSTSTPSATSLTRAGT